MSEQVIKRIKSSTDGKVDLQSLQIGCITDEMISQLASLTNLTRLYLGMNKISDISPLASLTNLTELYLHYNQISDISPLASLTNLTSLYLHCNQISDIAPLASLTNLTTLYLPYNQISDISPLASLTNLTELYLHDNQISDISPLASLTNLTTLYLSYNQISDTINEKFVYVDGVFAYIESYKKGKYWKVRMLNGDKAFLVTDGNGLYSHGETLREAQDGLAYKINEDAKADDYKGFSIDSVVLVSDVVKMYRVITGACSFGVKSFIESKGIDLTATMSILNVIEITDGQYGHYKFKAFFLECGK